MKMSYRQIFGRKLFPFEQIDLYQVDVVVAAEFIDQHQYAANWRTTIVHVQIWLHAGVRGVRVRLSERREDVLCVCMRE